MGQTIYGTTGWQQLREAALARDGSRCTIARLFGGECSPVLLVHHVIPIQEGGPVLPDLDGVLTVCAVHHPQLHAFRRAMRRLRKPTWKRCTHHHPYPHGRRECERRLNRTAA